MHVIVQSNIVGGGNVTVDKYRWFAEPLQSYGYWQFCGGSLVTPEYVLTEAYCVGSYSYYPIISYKIGALSKDDTVQNSVNETIDIANVTANDNDFALVKLKQRVNAITIAPVMMDQGTVSPNYPSGEF